MRCGFLLALAVSLLVAPLSAAALTICSGPCPIAGNLGLPGELLTPGSVGEITPPSLTVFPISRLVLRPENPVSPFVAGRIVFLARLSKLARSLPLRPPPGPFEDLAGQIPSKLKNRVPSPPTGVEVEIVPEASSAILVALSLLATGAAGRRGRGA